MAAKSKYAALTDDICVRLGWCGCIDKNGKPLHINDFIPAHGPVHADQFAEWTIMADGLDPDSESARAKGWKETVRASFIRHMGAEVVDASELHWTDDDLSDDSVL